MAFTNSENKNDALMGRHGTLNLLEEKQQGMLQKIDKIEKILKKEGKTIIIESLPACKDLMNTPNSPYKDGSFLTRHTIPVSWHPRVDGSRELRHSMCTLHRYSVDEARQCFAGKHMFMPGDSISRYLFLSLATFLHKGHYPPRFGVTGW